MLLVTAGSEGALIKKS